MTDLPIQWGAATIVWTPEGHVLRAPLWLNERAAYEFEQAIPNLIDGSFAWEVRGGVWRSDASGTTAEPGLVSIRSTRLFDLDGVKLRLALQRAAQQAKEKADADEAEDESRAAQLLEELRREETGDN